MNKTQGRKICDVLKEIRGKIAKEGNLELNQKECTYKGECSGTCLTCEAELKKINETFSHKKLLAIAGATSFVLPIAGCSTNQTEEIQGDFELREDILIAKEDTTNNELPDDILSGKIVPKEKEVASPQEYVFTEDEDFPKGVTTLENLEVEENIKNLIRKDFPNNHLRGVINPNVKFK